MIKSKLVLFLRHLSQTTISCLTAMTRGDFSAINLGHWQIALTTGLIAGFVGVGFSFSSLFIRYGRTIAFAIITFISTVVADFFSHPSHYGSFAWGHGEAIITALGAVVISLMISFSPVATHIDRLDITAAGSRPERNSDRLQ